MAGQGPDGDMELENASLMSWDGLNSSGFHYDPLCRTAGYAVILTFINAVCRPDPEIHV